MAEESTKIPLVFLQQGNTQVVPWGAELIQAGKELGFVVFSQRNDLGAQIQAQPSAIQAIQHGSIPERKYPNRKYRKLGVPDWAWEQITGDRLSEMVQLYRSSDSEVLSSILSALMMRSSALLVDGLSLHMAMDVGLPMLAVMFDIPIYTVGHAITNSPWVGTLSKRVIHPTKSEIIAALNL